ncbi:MAG: AAA family ATPase [Oscillospiraceae bacterium]|jgi:RecA-family ATPase|nr:AAA family ATPase [Oscillospiraceae bacterium]
MENTLDLLEALEYIDPTVLDYDQWLAVGMGLKEAGYSASVWEDWSRRDGRRFHSGECQRKWNSFNGSTAEPVTGGTVVKMAMDMGWRPASSQPGHELSWDDEINAKDEQVIVNTAWLESKEIQEPPDSKWRPAHDLIEYLGTLFSPDDYVGYVTETFEAEDGERKPTRGNYDRTAGQLIEALKKCGDDLGAVLGDYDPGTGAWIRFNPLDGKGVKNDNVTAFRFALIESDSMELGEQNALIRELELPVACLVYSGGKSLHAIVRIDAASYEEYRTRVDYLYSVCEKNGMKVDKQNRNPSRLSRLPGAVRNGHKQFLVDTNIGKASWSEWREWIESVSDDMPDPENMASAWDNLPQLAPPLIEGVLRQGHKLLLAGPSKAGKSYALIELCCSIAEGRPWLGFSCAQGRVLYVNLELDRASCLHRFRDVYEALGYPPEHLGSIDVWNLRGRSIPMDKLAPKLIRRCLKKNYIAIVIDPIYKVITGDENSADQMAKFCNQFDKVCTELGCAVIYCHHHSKGSQGSKRSMDRASGSGVFARDPDALLDLIELPIGENLRKQEMNNAVGRACRLALQAAGKLDEVSQDDLCSEKAALAAVEAVLGPQGYRDALAAAEAAKRAAEARTAWRIDGTLREFPKFPPVNLWFDFPVHRNDESGVLADIDPEGDTPGWQRNFKKKKSPEARKKDKEASLETAFDACNFGEEVTLKVLAEYMGVSEDTVRRRVNGHKGFYIAKGTVGRKATAKS